MNYKIIPSSQGRSSLPQIIKEVDEQGSVYVLTVRGVGKVAVVNLDLFQEFIENAEYGISEKELVSRASEDTMTLEELKSALNV